MMWLRGFLVWLVAARATDSTSYPCGGSLPLGCSCHQSPANESNSLTVSCRQIDFSRGNFWLDLPPQSETIIVQETDLDTFPSSDLFLSSSASDQLRSSVKYLWLTDNHNSQQKLNLQSLLCFFPQLEELHVVNNSLLDSFMNFNSSCSSQLKVLNLTGNFARLIPVETLKVLEDKQNIKVDLRENSFSCDCNFVATHTWLIKHRMDLVDPESYVCRDAYPEFLAGTPVLTIEASQFRCFEGPVLVPVSPYPHAHDRIGEETLSSIYSVVIVLGVVASIVALFAFFLHFPFLLQCLNPEPALLTNRKKSNSKRLLLQRRKYSSLPSLNLETPA